MKRIPELDGVRGVAVLAVLGVHLGLLRGGTIGVDVFFTLSGFLITAILLAEFEATDTISLSSFYLRRSFRLLPALFTLIAVCLIGNLIMPVFHVPTWQAVASVIFYFANWQLVLYPPIDGHEVLGPLAHCWSLSIEEQFYLTWPLILLAALRAKVSKNVIASALATVCVALLCHRLYLRHLGAPYSRLYFATDTHADGLLIGCAVALLKDRLVTVVPIKMAHFSGWGLVFLAFCAPSVVTYLGCTVFLAAALCTGVLLVHPQAMLRNSHLVYLGQRSYSLYLWHFILTEYWLRKLTALPVIVSVALVAAASLMIAEASYRWIEQPWLRWGRNLSYAKSDKSSIATAG